MLDTFNVIQEYYGTFGNFGQFKCHFCGHLIQFYSILIRDKSKRDYHAHRSCYYLDPDLRAMVSIFRLMPCENTYSRRYEQPTVSIETVELDKQILICKFQDQDLGQIFLATYEIPKIPMVRYGHEFWRYRILI